MGTMSKMRENTGVVLWILVFAFGIIWVLQDSGGLDVIGTTGGRDIGAVDGDKISYEDFSRELDMQMQQYQQATGDPMSPQMVEQTRERVFQAMVENKLREQEMDRLGIRVTDEEVYQMVMGSRPHPIITLYFGDGEGGVNRALLENFVNNPEARQDWIQIENYLRAERRREKMDNLIGASVRVSEQDVLDEYLMRNRRVDAQWVGLRFAQVPDDSVQLSETDLKRFYNENREEFRQQRTYSIQYVSRSRNASPEDSTRILEDLERLRPRFAAAEDDSLFMARNASDRPYLSDWFTADDLDDAVASAVFSDPTPGRIAGPVFSRDEAHLIKIQEVRAADETVVRASHILFRAPEDDPAVQERANEITRQSDAGADFAAMARQYSDDGSAAAGGDLGWFGRGRMVEPFERAAFSAAAGEVVGPVKSQFGYHLIKVTNRADREVKLADFALRIRADVATLNNIQEQLEDLRYYAEESGNFAAEAERLGLSVQQVQVEANQEVVPGIGQSRSLMSFLSSARRDAISESIELDDAFIVAHVQEIRPEGYRSFEAVRTEIEPRVRNEKKAALLRQRLAAALEQNGFEGMSGPLGTEIRNVPGLTFSSSVVPGLGREPKFVGTALGLDEGQVSDVLVGETAVYVLRATSIDEPAAITDATRSQIREQLLTQRRNQIRNQWLASLREKANVRDYRHRFIQ
jgi:peptidyl-prolyl cis-trans isomerase D